MKQRDLFPTRPSRVPGAAQREPYVVEPFDFDGLDPRLVPRPDVPIPDELKLPTDDDDWTPGAPI